MNTKGIKFLAVLAVLAMAFAAFAVIAPAEENDADYEGATPIAATPFATTNGTSYKITAEAATVTITGSGNTIPELYIPVGKTVVIGQNVTVTAIYAVYDNAGEPTATAAGVFTLGAVKVGNTEGDTISVKINSASATAASFEASGKFAQAATLTGTGVSGSITMSQATEYGVTFTTVTTPEKTSLSLTYNSKEYKFKAAGVTGVLTPAANNATFTPTAGSVLELMKGTYAESAVDFDATADDTFIVDEGVEFTFDDNSSVSKLYAFGKIAGPVDPADVGDYAAVAKLYVGASSEIDKEHITVPANGIADVFTGEYDIKGTLEANTTVGNAQLTGNLTIPEGMYLEVKENLFLDAYDVIVNGELRINANAQLTTVTGTITLGENGSIVNNGIMGKNVPVTVKVKDKLGAVTSAATLLAVKGVEFGYQKDGATPYLVVGGVVSKVDSNIKQNVPTLTLNKTFIDDMEIMSGVTLAKDTNAPTINGDAILVTNAGSTLTADVIVPYGAMISVDGFFNTGSITAQVFIEKTTQQIKDGIDFDDPDNLVVITSSNGGSNVSGFAIGVDRVQYSVKIDSVSTVVYDQRAYISGDLKLVKTGEGAPATNETLDIDGLLFVYALSELSLTSYSGASITVTGDNALVVEGLVSNYLASTKQIIGVEYTLKNDKKEDVKYATDYETGLAMLAVADAITIRGATGLGDGVGAYKLVDDFTIEKGKSVAFSTLKAIAVPAGKAIIVEEGGSLDARVISSLSGKVVVENGGTCSNMTTEIYQVVSTAADGTKTYAGLETVLSEAQSGDEILFPGDNSANVITAITIKDGITLKVSGSLYVRQITVEEGGVVTMTSAGSITMASQSTTYASINVSGKMDTTGGTFTFTPTAVKSVVKSTGQLIYNDAPFGAATIDGVEYQKDLKNVLSSIENAVAAGAEAMVIDGKYTSNTELVLDGTDLTIAAGAEANIASLDITDSTLTVNGTFSGSIVGIVGVGFDAQAVELKVTDFVGTITNEYTINAQGQNEYSMATAGDLTTKNFEIVSGTLVMNNDIQANATADKSTFKLDAGATLVVAANKSLGVAAGDHQYKAIVLNGKLSVSTGNLTIESPVEFNGEVEATKNITVNGNATIAGTFVLKKAATVVDMNGITTITGTITIPEGAEFDIGNTIVGIAGALGADSVVTGKMSLDNNSYVIVYNGGITADNFEVAVGKTVFQINGSEYFETFFRGAVDVAAVLNAADFTKISGLVITDITTDTKWKNVETGAYLAAGDDLADDLILNYGAAVTKVVIKTSWATGTSMYIDGVRVVNENYELEVGTHTIKVTVNPGYKGTNMVTTYKGATVTDKFTVATADAGAVLSLTGDISIDAGESPEPSPAEKEAFGITEILLVVLVILIAVMVIIVLLRMNRS